MDYKKAYLEALERAKNLQEKSNGMILNKWLTGVFPELVEPEDEKIRKDIMVLVKDWWDRVNKDNISTKEQMIAWLEKQGESNLIEEIKRRKELYSREKENAVLYMDRLSLGARIAMLEELLVFVNEKQGQKPTNDTNEVGQKFKVGDLVVKGNVIAQILDVQEQYYVGLDTEGNDFTSSRFLSDDKIHLWTIQDAKDGDVLISQYGKPFIYNGNYNSLNIGAYCGITCDDNFKVAEEKCQWTENVDIEPSTKEQRDRLFKAMKEAGYEWNAEKKELKKIGEDDLTEFENTLADICRGWIGEEHGWKDYIIKNSFPLLELAKKQFDEYEQKPTAWSDKDEEMCKITLSCIETLEDISNGKNMHTDIKDWLKSIKDRVEPKQKLSDEDKDMIRYIGNAITCEESSKYLEEKGIDMVKAHSWLESLKPQPKQEWSKEDENYLQSAENACAFHFGRNSEIINWLKSIKHRATWKPTGEQMEIFKELIDDNDQRFFYPTLKSLYIDLKKLKEE